MQHILVCAQDSVLAKKVRFLLARDEIDVEILTKPSQLEQRLVPGDVGLLIVSRSLAGEDAIDMLARFDPALVIPPTLVLGGQKRITADFIHLIPDPIDTQAIYRIATEILGTDGDEPYGAGGEEDLTHIQVERPHPKKRIQAGTIENKDSDSMSFTDVTGLDEIANQLDELESENLSSNLSDAFDIDEISSSTAQAAPPPREAPTAAEKSEVPGGILEPARFAKVLFQCWSRKTSGALVVARDQETLTIYFENGAPVHIESSIPGDPLGRALVTRGVITEEQYSSAAKRAIERGLTIGSSLVELGCFSGEELGKQKGQEATAAIVNCFAQRSGAFEFDQKRRTPVADRPYRLAVGHILAEGIRKHCDEPIVREIIGDMDTRYFKLNRPIEDLHERFPITDQEVKFLEFNGRAYNVTDASEVSGLPIKEAHKLVALLMTCEEIDDFTPGIHEFEARIREERARAKDLETQLSEPAPVTSVTGKPKASGGSFTSGGGAGIVEIPAPSPFDRSERSGERPVERPDRVERIERVPERITPKFERHEPIHVPPPPPPVTPPPPPPAHHTSPPNGDIDIPPMPVPANGEDGMVPRPLVYAKPLPRGPDGAPLETPERTLSREHFQRGVTLLGQGNFASAEEAFRDAVALCSEEHVYLIGLARAIYYNPGYKADGKVPVLRAIVSRAAQLAPEDNRVATLRVWVDHAEHQYNVKAMA
jgi:hypothetical protein